MSTSAARIDRTIAGLLEALDRRRTAAGHWEGQLSSSALATATAILALAVSDRGAHRRLVAAGTEWLVAHQNRDGGWGDTVLSRSNISTTLLTWSALSFARDAGGSSSAALDGAAAWLCREIGDLEPGRLREAVTRRYGRDLTFSVPILTTLAIAGRLGDGRAGWRQVPQLPFELSMCPHRWFQWLRLPVVSYALPALVAIGQVRHHHAPTRNLPLRALRTRLRQPTLDVLRRMQPARGGFLEATPLTSFVVMSLVAAGHSRHPVVVDGLRFLVGSVRADGSWPIDTNLATWVTTLALNAVGDAASRGVAETAAVRDWLLDQQLQREHPYTHAAPGGWAWTDLSGGVPDADDTAGALLALRRLGPDDPRTTRAAIRGIDWLLALQNRDGGVPTFCRGWGTLPFDRSAADLTAHALEAWSAWHSWLDPVCRRRVDAAMIAALGYLERSQSDDGSWIPLWFGNEHAASEQNKTYGTARVVSALAALPEGLAERASPMVLRGRAWLLDAQLSDGGWGGNVGAPPSIEETGVALQALARGVERHPDASSSDAARRAAEWLAVATDDGRRMPPTPIGLYFARLWYFEDLYPLVFAIGGLIACRDKWRDSDR